MLQWPPGFGERSWSDEVHRQVNPATMECRAAQFQTARNDHQAPSSKTASQPCGCLGSDVRNAAHNGSRSEVPTPQTGNSRASAFLVLVMGRGTDNPTRAFDFARSEDR